MRNCQSQDRRQPYQRVVLARPAPPDHEHLPRGACPQMPLTNEQRWAARKPAYNAFRNAEEYA